MNQKDYDQLYHAFMNEILMGMKEDYNMDIDLYMELQKKYLRRMVSNEDKLKYKELFSINRKDFLTRTRIMKEIDPDVTSKEIVVYGAGDNGKLFYEKYKAILNIKHIIDRDMDKLGSQIGELQVEGISCIDEIKNKKDILYVITVYKFALEIKQYLNKCGIKNEQICFSFMH